MAVSRAKSPIKSIQRGEFTRLNGGGTVINVAAVDVEKSLLTMSVRSIYSLRTPIEALIFTGKVLSPNQLVFNTTTNIDSVICWELVEYV